MMMRRRTIKKYFWVGLVCLGLLFTLISCGSDGGDPTGPRNLDVSGNWMFSGNISSNTCGYLQGEPIFSVGRSGIQMTQITQTGSNITASSGGNIFSSSDVFSGTLNGNMVSLANTNPSVINAGGCSAVIGGGMEIHTTSETSGSGSINVTTARVGGNCAALGALPCSVVWTGNWVRTSTMKRKSQKSSNAMTVTEQLQQILKR